MTTDNPRTRWQTICPICNGFKDHGLIACWSCFRKHNMRNCNLLAEKVVADFERTLEENAR